MDITEMQEEISRLLRCALKAEAERDRYKALAESRWDGAIEANQRADALAAHVERLSKAALDAIPNLPGGEIKASLRDAYDDTPSLARLKARWQAEEVQRIADDLREDVEGAYFCPSLDERAEELRRQAEER